MSSQLSAPFVRLRELEPLARALEADDGDDPARSDKWLDMLLALGASLGDARPESTMADVDGHLWVAKFRAWPTIVTAVHWGSWRRDWQRAPVSAFLRAKHCADES